jgi:hypothetical protein
MMRSSLLALSALVCIACAPTAVRPTVTPSATSEAGIAAIGRYRLTHSQLLPETSRDSIFRYSDGTASIVSVFRYDVPEDVKVVVDSQAWIAREGEKFAQVQDAFVEQGKIESYRVAFSGTNELAVDGAVLGEHSIAIAVKARGAVRMDFQYLYLIDGRFLKVRATFPGELWKTGEMPNFAREVARRAHRASK